MKATSLSSMGGGQNGHSSGSQKGKSRPLDISKPLQLVRNKEDLQTLDGVPELQSECQTLLASFKAFLAGKTAQKENTKPILTPEAQNISETKIVPKSTPKTNFLSGSQRTRHYIRYKIHKDQGMGVVLKEGAVVHFEMLREDCEFLRKLNMYWGRSTYLLEGREVESVCADDFAKLIDRLEAKTGRLEKEVSFDTALKCVNDLQLGLKSHLTREIYHHWLRRRRAIGHALCREYRNPTQSNDASPFATFRPRNRDRMTLRKPRKASWEVANKIDKMLSDFKKTDKIIRRIREHDVDRLQLADLKIVLFEQLRHEIIDPYHRSLTQSADDFFSHTQASLPLLPWHKNTHKKRPREKKTHSFEPKRIRLTHNNSGGFVPSLNSSHQSSTTNHYDSPSHNSQHFTHSSHTLPQITDNSQISHNLPKINHKQNNPNLLFPPPFLRQFLLPNPSEREPNTPIRENITHTNLTPQKTQNPPPNSTPTPLSGPPYFSDFVPSDSPASNLPVLNLPGSNMPGSSLPASNLPVPNLPGSNLPVLSLPGSNIPGSNSLVPNLPVPNLPGSNLPAPKLPGFNLPVPIFPGSNLPGSILPVGNLGVGNLGVGNLEVGNSRGGEKCSLGVTKLGGYNLCDGRIEKHTGGPCSLLGIPGGFLEPSVHVHHCVKWRSCGHSPLREVNNWGGGGIRPGVPCAGQANAPASKRATIQVVVRKGRNNRLWIDRHLVLPIAPHTEVVEENTPPTEKIAKKIAKTITRIDNNCIDLPQLKADGGTYPNGIGGLQISRDISDFEPGFATALGFDHILNNAGDSILSLNSYIERQCEYLSWLEAGQCINQTP